MLSLIRPSSSPCSNPHPDSLDLCATIPAPAPSNIASPEGLATSAPSPVSSLSNTSTFPARTATVHSAPQRNRPQFKPAPAPLNNAANYKAFIAQFTANAPQPYGVIPPRKKRTGPTARAAGSVSKVSLSSRNSSSTPPSPVSPVSSSNSLELLPTTKGINDNTTTNSNSNNESSESHFIQPLFHSLQSLLPESATSSSRLGFWANLKAQYLASTTSFSWSGNDRSQRRRGSVANSEAHILLPPAALRVANSAPVAAVDATPLRATPLTLSDAPLSLPNLASSISSTSTMQSYYGSVSYPVSVAAMDKFKVARSDTIPLKTFTYLETPVVDRPRSQSSVTIHTKNQATKTTGTLAPPAAACATAPKDSSNKRRDSSLLPPPLPRHLLTRETRSNADYLRMMASELRMIRSRKLISPLKPRGYLPRRKDPFRYAKSSLCEFVVPLREEDDHPLNDIMVGSWSSVSSSDTYMSATSAMSFHSANEDYF
ncbi:hypothetical protein EMPS_02326 [Entomortierella parvispora]|uniref:Uncharacterized protein n=1 Tax=Entomortierella parvispora TaxID=205924 RepID=A0A9P3H581_9FUNG|nr:hypothetical protein EMPS_02326 [Entomortierella parvispora]